jgi:hypothetical protein
VRFTKQKNIDGKAPGLVTGKNKIQSEEQLSKQRLVRQHWARWLFPRLIDFFPTALLLGNESH